MMIELYIHLSRVDAYFNYEPVIVTTMFPSSDHVKIMINPKDVNIFVQTDKLVITKKKPFIVKFVEKIKKLLTIGGKKNGKQRK